MSDISLWISALSLLISAWVIWRSGRTVRDARKEWVKRWKGDPEILAIVLSKLGPIERRRVKKELGL